MLRLYRNKLGKGSPLIILHGLFGSSGNWFTLGKEFACHFGVSLLDLRNHGNSPHSDTFDYEVMVKDVLSYMDEEVISKADILGHSMGGKVAMQLVEMAPHRVGKLIVVDIAPRAYIPHHQEVLEGFRSIDIFNVKTRKEADAQLEQKIKNVALRFFMLKNLKNVPNQGYRWKHNLNVIERYIDHVIAEIKFSKSVKNETLFIAGGRSNYITERDHVMIKKIFEHVNITILSDAGHWIHAEKPDMLKKMVLDFLMNNVTV